MGRENNQVAWFLPKKHAAMGGASGHRVFVFLKRGGPLFFFSKKPLWAESQTRCFFFLGQKTCDPVGRCTHRVFFFKKKEGGPRSKTRPTPLFFKKKHPMDRETNQIAFLLSKKHAAWLWSLATRCF